MSTADLDVAVSVGTATVSTMEATRWNRFGHERLYVRADDGTEIGWWDLKTNEPHPASAGQLDILVQAAVQWTTASATDRPGLADDKPVSEEPAGHQPDSCTPPARAEPEPPPDDPQPAPASSWSPPTGDPVRDLMNTPPGASLQDQVDAAHAAGQRPTLLRRLFLGKRAYSSWERGQIGERLVDAELHKLVERDSQWSYLNSIPIGKNGSDIDHVVIGPGGVFTINAKFHQGCNLWVGGDTFMVNGSRHPYIRNARFEARRTAKLLSSACEMPVTVIGLVVPVGADKLTIREQPADVHVVNRRRLVRFLRAQQPTLSPQHVCKILAAARLSTTWVAS